MDTEDGRNLIKTTEHVILACKYQGKCACKKNQNVYEIINYELQEGMYLNIVKCGGKENLFCLDFIRT